MIRVLILGASQNPNRYANQAQARLSDAGYKLVLVSPNYASINGIEVVASLDKVVDEIDVVTVYVNPQRLANELDSLLALKPKLVIFNPGSESPTAQKRLQESGGMVIAACTLVLLSTDQFEAVLSEAGLSE